MCYIVVLLNDFTFVSCLLYDSFQIKIISIRFFLQNLTTIEVKQSPLFFTRTRGLFRECYPGPKDKAPNHENQGQGDTNKISKYTDEIRKYWNYTIITTE